MYAKVPLRRKVHKRCRIQSSQSYLDRGLIRNQFGEISADSLVGRQTLLVDIRAGTDHDIILRVGVHDIIDLTDVDEIAAGYKREIRVGLNDDQLCIGTGTARKIRTGAHRHEAVFVRLGDLQKRDIARKRTQTDFMIQPVFRRNKVEPARTLKRVGAFIQKARCGTEALSDRFCIRHKVADRLVIVDAVQILPLDQLTQNRATIAVSRHDPIIVLYHARRLLRRDTLFSKLFLPVLHSLFYPPALPDRVTFSRPALPSTPLLPSIPAP